jgi:hypothetical protein
VSESDRWEAVKEGFVIEDRVSYDGLDELIDAGDALRATVARLEGELEAARETVRDKLAATEQAYAVSFGRGVLRSLLNERVDTLREVLDILDTAPAAGSEGAVKFSPDRSVACGGAYSDLGHGDCADTREPDVPCACWCHEAAGSEATVSYPLSVLDEGE